MLEGDGGNIEDLSQTAEPISSQPDSSSAPSEHVTKATKPTIFGKVPKKLESRLNFNEYKKWRGVVQETLDQHPVFKPGGFWDMDKIEALALSEYYSRKAKALNGELPKDIEDDDQYKEDISLGDKEALKRALYRQDLKAEEDQDAREIEAAAEKLRNITQTPGKLN